MVLHHSSWHLDNGVSNHMCGYKENFVALSEKINGNISSEDSSKIRIQGKYTIIISSKNDGYVFITNVYYVPKLRSNNLSLVQFLKNGYEIHMENYCVWLRDHSVNLITKVHKSKKKMFILNLKTI